MFEIETDGPCLVQKLNQGAVPPPGFPSGYTPVLDSKSFKFKSRITDNANTASTENVKIVVPLENLSYFWRTLEMPLINFEVTVGLNRSENCVICEVNRATTFAIASAKLYIPVVTLPTQDNLKLLQQLKSGFKRTIN